MPSVELVEEVTLSEPFMIHHTLTIRRWTITIPSSPSYRCVIQECPCGLRDQIGVKYEDVPFDAPDWNTRTRKAIDVVSVARAECLCTAQTCKLGRRVHKCHGWHRARIDQLVRNIEKMPKKHKINTSMHSYQGVAA